MGFVRFMNTTTGRAVRVVAGLVLIVGGLVSGGVAGWVVAAVGVVPLAAGLANGMTPGDMYRMFIESETADDPFEPDILLRPAIGDYLGRLAATPVLFLSALRQYCEAPFSRGFFESF